MPSPSGRITMQPPGLRSLIRHLQQTTMYCSRNGWCAASPRQREKTLPMWYQVITHLQIPTMFGGQLDPLAHQFGFQYNRPTGTLRDLLLFNVHGGTRSTGHKGWTVTPTEACHHNFPYNNQLATYDEWTCLTASNCNTFGSELV